MDYKRKIHNRYLFYRVFYILGISWILLNIPYLLSQAVSEETKETLWNIYGWSSAYDIHLILLAVILVFITFNLGVFRFKFSVLGTFERTAFPLNEIPLIKEYGAGMIGSQIFFGGLVFGWDVYLSGLGITIAGIGKCFIPVENILEFRETRFFKWRALSMVPFPMKLFMLEHSCPEIRSPIYFRNKKVFQALKNIKKLILPNQIAYHL